MTAPLSIQAKELIVKINNVKNICTNTAIAMLYQAGYLSIKHIDNQTAYLGFANYEVAVTLVEQMVNQVLNQENLTLLHKHKQAITCIHHGGQPLAHLINGCFNKAPDDLFDDHNRQTVITFVVHLLLRELAVINFCEVHYVKGRADLVVFKVRESGKNSPLVEDVVMEFKVARQKGRVRDLLMSGSYQVIDRNYGVSHQNLTPQRYCIVICNHLRGVGAIARIDDNNKIELVYQAPNLDEDLSNLQSKS